MPFPAAAPNLRHPVTRALLHTVLALLTLVLLGLLLIALLGWNWLRPPLERYMLQKTGRELVIAGDLDVRLDWPALHLQAAGVRFANPAWAQEKQMVSAQEIGIAVDLAQLLHGRLELPEVRLDRAAVFLEQTADGRKSWLLDLGQKDEDAQLAVGKVSLNEGTLGYDFAAEKTRLRANLSTTASADGALSVSAQGQYKGQAVQAKGRGGPVLALRDTHQPYPLTLEASAGSTHLGAQGSITGLQTFAAVDMRMALRGDSLERLYPLLGIAFPATPAYTTAGRLLRTGSTWRYEQFTGKVGSSDIGGFVQVVLGGTRPALTADLRSERLALEDLGPLVGTRRGGTPAATTPATAPAPQSGPRKVLPELPFNANRWDTVDADVQLRAKTLIRPEALPLEGLVTHLRMRDAVLALEPLEFGLAGGRVNAQITLDGRKQPIQAKARVRVQKVLLAQLFPTMELSKGSMGEINGEFDLSGAGNSVGTMLADANGQLRLVVANGQISRLLMEKIGLHLWEILALSLTGDQQVKLRCAVADFDVAKGLMQTKALVVDTTVTTVMGSGTIDLKEEALDLTLNPRTKNTSPLSLRSPIRIRGDFAQPRAEVDKGKLAARAAGVLALGAVNPLLALIPLVDAGPGKDSDCGQLVHDASK